MTPGEWVTAAGAALGISAFIVAVLEYGRRAADRKPTAPYVAALVVLAFLVVVVVGLASQPPTR